MNGHSDDQIYQLVSRLRRRIDTPHIQDQLISDQKKWLRLCSSLDVIEDVELAVAAYNRAEYPEEDYADLWGRLYLAIYGLLQSLVVQQDATRQLARVLDLPVQLTPEIEEIREIRNFTVGHPTNSQPTKRVPEASHHIDRSSISKSGYRLWTVFENGDESRQIDIVGLIRAQRAVLAQILERANELLQQTEVAHRKAFRDEKLEHLLPRDLDDHCRMIYQALVEKCDDRAEEAMASIGRIEECLESYSTALGKRGVRYREERFAEPCESVRRVLQVLRALLNSESGTTAPGNVLLFVERLESYLHHLRSMAAGVDEYYAEVTVTSVRPFTDTMLCVRFDDGAEGIVDVSKFVDLEGVFAPLRDADFFRQVSVNEELGCVCWPNGADLDSDVIYSTITGAPLPGQTSAMSA